MILTKHKSRFQMYVSGFGTLNEAQPAIKEMCDILQPRGGGGPCHGYKF
jgi:hypothetical protein